MSGIIPIPTTRVSGLLTRQRLSQQYQSDQLDLFRLQQQISTGLRITLPSEDAPSAIRAISLQRLLSRKDQLESNIQSGLQFLASTDDAVNDVATKLSEIKASALGVIDTIDTQEQRDAAIAQIDEQLDALVTLGNRKALGRYIFGGAETDQPPYSRDANGNIVYNGDDRSIRSYSDLGVLFASNASGQEVFGGFSDSVQGTVDLNPHLSSDTLLSSLRGGRGVNLSGAVQLENATTNDIAIVDLSNASTVGDVVRLLEDNAPSGSNFDVAITGSGLQITELGGDTIAINEVASGNTARELGILGGPSTTITGEDLDPAILKTSQIDDLLGSKARTAIRSAGSNNDILIEGAANGGLYDTVAVSFVDGGGGSPVSVAFDGGAKTLVVTIDAGATTAQEVVDAINADANFTAEIDAADSTSISEAGSGLIDASATATTTGGIGSTLNQSSGIRVVNGGNTYDITFDNAETVEDLLNILNSSEAGLLAEINDSATGINIRSRLSGSDFQIGEVGGGNTATQLGVRTYDGDTRLSDFNYGVGVPTRNATEINLTQSELNFTASDGSSFTVDLTGAPDLATAIASINAEAVLAGVDVTMQPDPSNNNGLIVADETEGPGRLSITQSGADNAITGGIDFTIPSHDISFEASTGDSFTIDVTGAETVQEVLDLINNDNGNDDGFGNPLITARIALTGNGIELVDDNGGSLTVTSLESSEAAQYLGLVADGETTNTSVADTLTGTDRHFLETDSVFTTLIRLRDALAANDVPAVGRAVAKIDEGITQVTFSQASVGSRLRGLELTRQNLQDEVIQLRSALSEEIDVDLVQAISELTARQISLEASLRTSANILQLSLLNFI